MKAENRIQTTPQIDWAMVSIVATLLVIGAIMVFSASFSWSMAGADHPFYFRSGLF